MLLTERCSLPHPCHTGCRLARLPSRSAPQICRSRGSCRQRTAGPCRAAALDFDALLFDCDGVLCDTEAEGHRDLGDNGPFASKPEGEQQALVKELHLLKTDIFMEMIEGGSMPLRPGILRLVKEAVDAGLRIAVCSTSNERAVSKIVEILILPSVPAQIRVFAGDVVPKKKPDPAIYNLAAKELGLEPSRCVVVEDSAIGLKAAKAAGMRCLVTRSSYTKSEDFSAADAVVDELEKAGVSLQNLTVDGLAHLKH